jgi:hypothetical protein
MRTHIRMHLDKKSGEFNEENYISCILDDDSTEIPPASAHKTPSPETIERNSTNKSSHSPITNGSSIDSTSNVVNSK